MARIEITLGAAVNDAYADAPLDLAVPQGCLGFYVFGGALDRSILNHAGPNQAQLTPLGTFKPQHFADGFVSLQSTVRYFDTGITDRAGLEIFVGGKTDATLADAANRPVMAATMLSAPQGTVLSEGGRYFGYHNTSTRLTAFHTTLSGSARADIGATAPNPSGAYDHNKWSIMNGRFSTSEVFVRDYQRGIQIATPVSNPVQTYPRTLLLGSGTTAYQGTLQMSVAAVYSATLTDAQRALVVQQLSDLMTNRGLAFWPAAS